MKLKLNANERHIVRVLLFLSSFYGLAIILLTTFIQDSNYKTLISIAFVIATFIILFLGQEFVFGTLLVKVIPATKPKRSITDGYWNIQITYNDSSCEGEAKKITRNGTLQFKNSIIGVKIQGRQLIDHETKTIVKEGWLADDAEIIPLEEKEVLVYLYKIPQNKKAGIVVAVRNENEEKFKGLFKDISFKDEKVQREREGDVILFKVEE